MPDQEQPENNEAQEFVITEEVKEYVEMYTSAIMSNVSKLIGTVGAEAAVMDTAIKLAGISVVVLAVQNGDIPIDKLGPALRPTTDAVVDYINRVVKRMAADISNLDRTGEVNQAMRKMAAMYKGRGGVQ